MTKAILPARWELGGDFSSQDHAIGPWVAWPQPNVWFASGRDAIEVLHSHLCDDNRSALWLPDYFCEDVADYLGSRVKVERYADDPRWDGPDWDTLSPATNDVVVAVNYFGIRDFAGWRAWRRLHECVLVEDHTHDPLGSQAINSPADYIFSSLRKTLPVPDGAILWSPRDLPLPACPDRRPHPGAVLRANAMALKDSYLAGSAPADSKAEYRELFAEGERQLEQVGGYAASEDTLSIAAPGIPVEWRNQREANVVRWNEIFVESSIVKTWPAGATPFATVLLLSSQSQRDSFRNELQQARVYCPIHWAPAPGSPDHVKELSSRVLTLPSDQRYKDNDLTEAIQRIRALKHAPHS